MGEDAVIPFSCYYTVTSLLSKRGILCPSLLCSYGWDLQPFMIFPYKADQLLQYMELNEDVG